MSKVYIDVESWELLDLWAKNNKWKVINALPFFNKTTVYLKEHPEYEAHFQKRKYGYSFKFRENKRQVAIGKSIIDDESEQDVSIHFDVAQELNENMNEGLLDNISFKIRSFVDMFLISNAFLWYGNIADEKNLIAQGKNLNSDKIIVFRKFKDTVYAVPTGHHRSPEGVFEVRGHFRKYKKSGKVVWIDSYIKGAEKNEE